MGHGPIDLPGLTSRKLSHQRVIGGIALSHHHAARSIFVETVNNAGTILPCQFAQPTITMMQECVYQGAIQVSGRGVNDKTVWFIDHYDVLILEQYVDINGFRLKLCGAFLRN